MPGPTTMKIMKLQMGTPEEKAGVERELEEGHQTEAGPSGKKEGRAGRKIVEADGVCPTCDGRGHMNDGDPHSTDSYGFRPTECGNCKGSGTVPVKIFVTS